MSVSFTLAFEVVTFHARGAWPYRDGEMTHSAQGIATLASGEIVSFDVSRYFVPSAPRGERVSYTVALYSAARRELTADKWGAMRGEISRAFKRHVESMADGPRPASIYPARDASPAPLESAPVRRDNVEYHAGRKAFADGESVGENPYPDGGGRAARWNLGWHDAAVESPDPAPTLALAVMGPDSARLALATLDSPPAPERGGIQTDESGRQWIDMTPTWGEILPTLLAIVTDGDAKGRANARDELARMAGLADSYVAARKAFAALAGERR